MLPGFSGQLVSESFLEHYLANTTVTGGESRYGEFVKWHRRCAGLGPVSSVRAILQVAAAPLVELLTFESISAADPAQPLLFATTRAGERLVAVVVAPWSEPLDSIWRPSVLFARSRGARWILLFNGTHIRIVDAVRLYSRRFAEFDLDTVADDTRSFEAFWCLCSAGAYQGTHVGALKVLVDGSADHGIRVCASLRDGVVGAATALAAALLPPGRSAHVDAAFEQSLTLVYRLLFLLFAEARGLVPMWHAVYRDAYSVESLQTMADRPGRSKGLWDALRAIGRLAHAGCRIGDLRVTPFNGRLFAPARTPLADRHRLDDAAAQRAVLALTTRGSASGRQRIAYRDLGVEELGAVYERLLDYTPRVTRRERHVDVELLPGAGVRKATGTFYTPQPVAEYLVRRTLAPLVAGRTPDDLLRLRVVDPAMGSGAFLVAACVYLARAYEQALVRAGGCHPSDFDESDRALFRRTIAERCLYGVDINPMAVQLARLSLWLTTLAADRPLTFLDHRLVIGDSLIGTWLGRLRQAPPAGRRRGAVAGLPLFDDAVVRDAILDTLPARFALESIPNDTIDQVRSKERTMAALSSPQAALSKWKRVADAWCARWFQDDSGLPACPRPAFGAIADWLLTGQSVLPDRTIVARVDATSRVASDRRFLHWEIAFPEVFFNATGTRRQDPGFDAVIGNPPWDMIRADPGVTGGRAAITALVRFTRDSGLYSAQSDGHPNRYQLFAERSLALVRHSGRIGLVLPSGLALDRGSAGLRRRLFSECAVDGLVGIDNRRGVFPIHRGVGFLLLTATAGTVGGVVPCRFGVEDPGELEAAGDDSESTSWFPVRFSAALVERLSGPALTIPLAKTMADVSIAERSASLFPALEDVRGWSARFGRELNASDDRDLFRPAERDLPGLPVIEGKHLRPFAVDIEASRLAVRAGDLRKRLTGDGYTRPRLAYRDVASATNKQTLIAAVLPAGCVSTHTVFCLRTSLPSRDQHFLCGLFNSFVVNYLVRLRVTTHVTAATIARVPVPTRDHSPAAHREIAALARLLARRFDAAASARLQARVAELYQLTEEEFRHVVATFPLVGPEEREAALTLFADRYLLRRRI